MSKTVAVSPLTFGQKLSQGFTQANIDKVIALAQKKGHESELALLSKVGKYSYVVGKGKQAKKYQLMNLVNLVCGLTHGDYHPNRVLALCDKVGIAYTHEGDLPISHPSRKAEYDKVKADKVAPALKESKKPAKGKVKVVTVNPSPKAIAQFQKIGILPNGKQVIMPNVKPIKAKKPLPTGKTSKK